MFVGLFAMKRLEFFIVLSIFLVALTSCTAVPLSQGTKERIARLEWSPISKRGYNIRGTGDGVYPDSTYCNDLNKEQYGGHNDWRLPTIDELRSIIQNCSGTELEGECRISEANDNLSYYGDYTRRHCHACKGNNPQEHSKLPLPSPYIDLVSTSKISDYTFGVGYLYGVDFHEYGSVILFQEGVRTHIVCVRNS